MADSAVQNTPLPAQPDAPSLMEQKARELEAKYVEPRIEWYRTHTTLPRFFFRWAGITTILFSVTLPALAALTFAYKEWVLSFMSIAIAALTGFSSFYKWERTWHANSTAQVALQSHVARWELELANARLLPTPQEQAAAISKATGDLLTNASTVVNTESEGFFSALAFPQQNTGSKDA